MDIRDELLGQAKKSGQLPDEAHEREDDELPKQGKDTPAIPYGNPGRPERLADPDEPDVSSFA